jgi:molybdopterin-guanine dinucleotide biosynthesis protein A
MQRLGAVILCGGRSRRMGRPKEWLPIGDEVLLQRVVRHVSTRASLVVLAAAEGQELPVLPAEVERVVDPEPDRGPLQGMAIGMRALAGRVHWAFACASDAPLLQPRWIDRLYDFTSDDVDLILPHVEGRAQPLAALYRPELTAQVAAELLASGLSALHVIRTRLRTRRIGAEDLREVDPDLMTLRNLNVPSDYQDLIRSLDRPESSPIKSSRD